MGIVNSLCFPCNLSAYAISTGSRFRALRTFYLFYFFFLGQESHHSPPPKYESGRRLIGEVLCKEYDV